MTVDLLTPDARGLVPNREVEFSIGNRALGIRRIGVKEGMDTAEEPDDEAVVAEC